MADPDPDSIYKNRGHPSKKKKRRNSFRDRLADQVNVSSRDISRRRKKVAPTEWGQALAVGGLLLVMLGYMGLLGLSAVKKWTKARARAAVAGQVVPAEPEPVRAPGLVTARALHEHIQTWERSRRFIRDLSPYSDNPDRAAEAEGHLNRALELSPENLVVKAMLARNLLVQQRFEQAASLALEVLSVDPEDVNTRLTLARALAGAEAHEETLVMAKWLIQEDAIGLEGHRLAMQAHLDLKQPGQAIEHINKVLRVEPDNFALMIKLAGAYSDLEKHESAIDVLEKTLEREGTSSAALFSLASNYADLGDVDQTLRILTEAADDLGQSFVATWLQSEAFDEVRSDPALEEFLKLAGGQRTDTNTLVEGGTSAEP